MVRGLNKNNPVFKVSTSADFDRRIISKIYKDPVIRNKERGTSYRCRQDFAFVISTLSSPRFVPHRFS